MEDDATMWLPASQILNSAIKFGRLTGAGQHSCAAALQRRDFRRNVVARRVLQAGIEIPGRFEVKDLPMSSLVAYLKVVDG